MPRSSSRTSNSRSTTRRSSGPHAKVKKLEAKMNSEHKKAQRSAQNLNKIKKDLIKACQGEIKVLKSKTFKNKSTQAYKNNQKKIRSLTQEIKQCRKPKVFKA